MTDKPDPPYKESFYRSTGCGMVECTPSEATVIRLYAMGGRLDFFCRQGSPGVFGPDLGIVKRMLDRAFSEGVEHMRDKLKGFVDRL